MIGMGTWSSTQCLTGGNLKLFWSAVAVIGIASLTGCSSSTPQLNAPTVEAAGPTNEATDAPSPAPTTTAAPLAPSETPTATEPAESKEPTKSSRGNLVKQVGDSFGAYDPDDPEAEATFRVTGLSVDSGCTASDPEKAENGHFLRLDIEGEVSPAMVDGFFFGPWKVIAENGTTFNGDVETFAAFICLKDSEVLPSTVGPGERVTGSIVLDVPTSSGFVILLNDGLTGWEWEFPQ